jgi:hypothetical protein
MRNAFLAAVFISVVSGCAAPKPYLMQSTTWMAAYRYTTSDSSGFGESQKAAVIHCKEYGKSAEIESITSLDDFTTLATFHCK